MGIKSTHKKRFIWTKFKYVLKGTVSRDFLLQVFFMNHLPQAPDNIIRIISNFFENLRRYLQVKVHHRCQRHRRQICHRCHWHRWQIMGTISGCSRHLKVNLKAKIYIYVSSTTQRWPNNIIKVFYDWRFFPFATGVVDTGGKPWAANISANFLKNSKRS